VLHLGGMRCALYAARAAVVAERRNSDASMTASRDDSFLTVSSTLPCSPLIMALVSTLFASASPPQRPPTADPNLGGLGNLSADGDTLYQRLTLRVRAGSRGIGLGGLLWGQHRSYASHPRRGGDRMNEIRK
jgi:hypothetical protein